MQLPPSGTPVRVAVAATVRVAVTDGVLLDVRVGVLVAVAVAAPVEVTVDVADAVVVNVVVAVAVRVGELVAVPVAVADGVKDTHSQCMPVLTQVSPGTQTPVRLQFGNKSSRQGAPANTEPCHAPHTRSPHTADLANHTTQRNARITLGSSRPHCEQHAELPGAYHELLRPSRSCPEVATAGAKRCTPLRCSRWTLTLGEASRAPRRSRWRTTRMTVSRCAGVPDWEARSVSSRHEGFPPRMERDRVRMKSSGWQNWRAKSRSTPHPPR